MIECIGNKTKVQKIHPLDRGKKEYPVPVSQSSHANGWRVGLCCYVQCAMLCFVKLNALRPVIIKQVGQVRFGCAEVSFLYIFVDRQRPTIYKDPLTTFVRGMIGKHVLFCTFQKHIASIELKVHILKTSIMKRHSS